RLWALDTGQKRVEVWDSSFTARADFPIEGDWPVDFALSGDTFYVAAALSNRLEAYDAQTGALKAQAASAGLYPSAIALGAASVYVANQGAQPGRTNRVAVFDRSTLALTASYEVGKNPAALALAPDESVLYVAASDDDSIDRIDLARQAMLPSIPLFQPGRESQPAAGLTVSPNALALSGSTLYVSAAMLDAILVIATARGAQVGAIPAGFRPNAVLATPSALYVANGKGNGTTPGGPFVPGQWAPDNSNLPRGTIERIPLPQDL